LLVGRVGLHGRISAVCALAAVSFAPAITNAGVLARPYGLASLGVVLVLVSLFPRVGRSPSGVAWMLALLGLGVAARCDLIAGLAALTLLILALAQSLLHRGRAATPRAAFALLAALAFCAPIAPGAARAAREQVQPAPTREGAAAPDLRPTGGMGGGNTVALVRDVAIFGGIGADPSGRPVPPPSATALLLIGSVVFVAFVAWRPRDLATGLALFTLVALCVIAGRGVALRARNILFLPHASALFVAHAIAEWRRTTEDKTSATKPRTEHQAG
jgi:hypothetical protein